MLRFWCLEVLLRLLFPESGLRALARGGGRGRGGDTGKGRGRGRGSGRRREGWTLCCSVSTYICEVLILGWHRRHLLDTASLERRTSEWTCDTCCCDVDTTGTVIQSEFRDRECNVHVGHWAWRCHRMGDAQIANSLPLHSPLLFRPFALQNHCMTL